MGQFDITIRYGCYTALLLIFIFYAVKFLLLPIIRWYKLERFIRTIRNNKNRSKFKILTTGSELIVVSLDEELKMTEDDVRIKWAEKIL